VLAPSTLRPTGASRVGLARAVALGWLARYAPPVALALVVTAAYVPLAGEYFQGNDTWAHIWTSLDVPRVLTQPIMAGTSFPDTWALFYRPVSSLSYALNYAVSGLNPTAFHLTDLLIHLLATFGLYSLAVLFGLRRWAAAVGAATFALHPVMASVVPDLPRRHDPLAMACLFGALLLAARPRTGGYAALAGSLVLLALGELAKEVAYLGPVLVGPTMSLAAWTHNLPLRQAWRRIVATVGAWGGVSLALLAWRFHVLGDIGGYHMHMAPLFDLDVALNDILRNLLWPFRAVLQTTLRAWLTELGLAVLIAGLPCLLVRRAARATLLYGWLWLAAFGLFQGLSHSQAPWHTYFTVAGLGFLAAGVFDGAAASLRAGSFAAWLRPAWFAPRLAARAILVGCVAGALVFQVAALRESTLLTTYSAWHITGELGRLYLADIRPCLRSTPPGEPVVLDNFPYRLDDSSDQYVLVQAGVFASYALGPAIALADDRPDIRIIEDAGQGATLGSLPRALHTTCAQRAGTWWIQTTYER
jgi:hypothetical protein